MSIIYKNYGDDTAEQEAILTGIIATLSLTNLGILGINAKKKSKGELSVSDKLNQIRLSNTITNISLIAYVLGRYYFGNTKKIQPAAVLAGVPLGTVEELSMALSDRIVKYRATGGIFLAHQDGGNESLRIICKAWGKERYMFLILLDFIFRYGRSKILDLFSKLLSNPIGGISEQYDKAYLAETAKINNPWKRFDKENTDEGREEYHMTFPVVTKNRIFSSMYLETYDIVENVDNAMNVLTVSLFLRKYRTSYPLELVKVKELKKGRKKPDITHWYRAKKEKESTIYTKSNALRWIDSVLDFGLSLLVMAHKYIMLQKYSIYTPEQMFALSFATHLDKSSGLNNGHNIGINEDKDGNITTDSLIEESQGIIE